MSPETYLVLKWLHIAAASIAFGSNVTHFFWLLSANRDPANRANILRLVKRIDDRLAVPAYVVAILCGAVMWYWRWPADSSWAVLSLVLTLILAAMGTAYGPFMKRWIRQAQAHADSGALPLTRVLTFGWAAISVSVFVILYLMVWKPSLW